MFSSFFFNDTATTAIYTLSLHDALPIWVVDRVHRDTADGRTLALPPHAAGLAPVDVRLVGRMRWKGKDRKSTRLNSSHMSISYAVFCLKKKKYKEITTRVITKCKVVYCQ